MAINTDPKEMQSGLLVSIPSRSGLPMDSILDLCLAGLPVGILREFSAFFVGYSTV